MNEVFCVFLRRSRRDAVGVEPGLLGQHLPLVPRLLLVELRLLGGPEPPAALLVHLGPGGDAVHGQEEHLLGLDHAEQHLGTKET